MLYKMKEPLKYGAQLFIGIDPGQSGAVVVIDADSHPVGEVRGSQSCTDRAGLIEFFKGNSVYTMAVLERVHSMPKQGIASSFKFGQSFGESIGILEACCIRYELVTPNKWQTAMKCKSGGDKNVTKHAAQRLFPNIKIIHANADAFLLAEYARRLAVERGLVNGRG